MLNKRTKGTVEVEILKPFHIGIDNTVSYKPGKIVELDKATAMRAVEGNLAKYKASGNNNNQYQNGKKS